MRVVLRPSLWLRQTECRVTSFCRFRTCVLCHLKPNEQLNMSKFPPGFTIYAIVPDYSFHHLKLPTPSPPVNWEINSHNSESHAVAGIQENWRPSVTGKLESGCFRCFPTAVSGFERQAWQAILGLSIAFSFLPQSFASVKRPETEDLYNGVTRQLRPHYTNEPM